MSKEEKQSEVEAPNYWKMKDAELKALIKDRELPYEINDETFNRKAVIDILRISDVYLGKASEALEQDDETDDVSSTMNKKGYVKVRFHNTSDNDVPYVFVGHNGKSFYIPKEKDIWVPKYLLTSVIKDAVEIRMKTERKGDKMVQVPYKYQRFPYTIVA